MGALDFYDGSQYNPSKTNTSYVRAIRDFSIGNNVLNIDSKGVTISGSLFLKEGVILATGSNLIALSENFSVFGYDDGIKNYPSQSLLSNNTALFIANGENYPISNGPGAQIQILTGSQVSAWYYDWNGTSYLPGDVNIGFDAPLSQYLTSGSLNIRNGNINLSGSLNVSSSIISLDKVDAPNINVKGGNISFNTNGAGILHTGQLNITTVFEDNALAKTWVFNQYGTLTTPGNINLSGSLIVTDTIQGTGSIFLQPDVNDARKIEIYNTAPTDTHIKATGGLTFLGDDTNYVKIDDSSQTVSINSVNGIFVNQLPSIGQVLEGGKVAYILTSNDAGYDPTLIKGIVAAEEDEAGGNINWYAATASIDNKTTNGYTDWYLPSKEEIYQLYLNQIAIGGFGITVYWSSTEYLGVNAWIQDMPNGTQATDVKTSVAKARAIRQFSIPKNTFNIIGKQQITGSLNVTGSVKLSTTDGAGDSLDLIIGQTTDVGPNGYQIKASGSTENGLFLISNLASLMIAQGTVSNPGDTSLFATQVVGIENNGGPDATLQLNKSGSAPAQWFYDYTATSKFPGDINIGYNIDTSGSLNIRNGNINVTGSVNIDNAIKLKPVTNFPNGEAGMLVASASYGKTNLYVYDGSNWKWLVTGSIA